MEDNFSPFFDIHFGDEDPYLPENQNSYFVLERANFHHNNAKKSKFPCDLGHFHSIDDLPCFPYIMKTSATAEKPRRRCVLGTVAGHGWTRPTPRNPVPEYRRSISGFIADRKKILQLSLDKVGLYRYLETLEDQVITAKPRCRPDIFKNIFLIRKFLSNLELYFTHLRSYDWDKCRTILDNNIMHEGTWLLHLRLSNFSKAFDLLNMYKKEADSMQELCQRASLVVTAIKPNVEITNLMPPPKCPPKPLRRCLSTP